MYGFSVTIMMTDFKSEGLFPSWFEIYCLLHVAYDKTYSSDESPVRVRMAGTIPGSDTVIRSSMDGPLMDDSPASTGLRHYMR